MLTFKVAFYSIHFIMEIRKAQKKAAHGQVSVSSVRPQDETQTILKFRRTRKVFGNLHTNRMAHFVSLRVLIHFHQSDKSSRLIYIDSGRFTVSGHLLK